MSASLNVTPIRPGIAPQPDLFQMEPCQDFDYDPSADTYLISDLLPGSGLGVIYGASRSFKSFVTLDIALRVSQGWCWGGRRTEKTTFCYIVAEGRAGMRKRRAGWFRANPSAAAEGAGHFVSAAPNLGIEKGDLEKLIRSISTCRARPGLIVIDTLAQTIGGADENGAGMAMFVKNATALAERFAAMVLVVHHTGHGDGLRMRGFSGLPAACDVVIACEGKTDGGAKEARLFFEKCKDTEAGHSFVAKLRCIALSERQDGSTIDTLFVDEIEPIGFAKRGEKKAGPSARAQGIFKHLAELVDKGGFEPTPHENIPPGAKVVKVDDWRDYALKKGYGGDIKPASKTRTFGRDKAKLAESDLIGEWDGVVWVK